MPYPKTMPQSFGPLPSEGVERASSARGRQPVVESQGVSGNLPKAAPPGSTPSQWLGQAAPGQAGDPLSLLVGGITQLQAARKKQDDGDASPEAVKPGTSTLPTLKPVESTTSSVELQDWMEMIAPAMADLSNSSAQWWTKVRTLAEETYALWSRASPLQRLNVQPPLGTDLESGKWARVNARGASMLMSAVDQSVGAELVARRLTQICPGIIFRLMTLYQPGGEQENSSAPSGPSNGVYGSHSSRVVEDMGEVDETLGGHQPHKARPDHPHSRAHHHHPRCFGNRLPGQLPDVVGEEFVVGGCVAYLPNG